MQMPIRESIYKRYVPSVTPSHDPEARVYWFVFGGGKLLMNEAAEGLLLPYMTEESLADLGVTLLRKQYLGTFDGDPCYSAETETEAADEAVPAGYSYRALRTLYGSVEEDLFHLAGRACQIAAWDREHQYCGCCGKPTALSDNDRAKVCPACGTVSYPRISPAVITAILKGEQILLAHARHFQGNMYSIIAGFVEPGETLEDCVRREIMEEVGIKVRNIRYFGSQQWPFPNSLMIGFVADYDSGEIQVDGEEIVDAGWYGPDNLPVIPSEISIARKIIDWYVNEYSAKS